MASSSPSLTVLHLGGSNATRFYFECSYLYCQAACRFPDKGVKNYYAMLLPPSDACPGAGRFAMLEDELPKELLATDLMDLKYLKNPALASKVTLLSKAEFLAAMRGEGSFEFAHAIQLVVPHMYDNVGLTAWRTLMADKLKLPVVGPPGSANVLAQDKVACREVLEKLTITSDNNQKNRIVPAGFVMKRDQLVDADGNVSDEVVARMMARVRAEVGGFPVMMKSPLEDNSRGVRIIGRRCLPDSPTAVNVELAKEIKSTILELLGMGDILLFEQFIPGREMRFGVIELRHPKGLDAYRHDAPLGKMSDIGPSATSAKLHGVPTMLEYLLNPSMPIRTQQDKLTTDKHGQMTQTKSTRRLISSDPRVHASPDPKTGKIPAKLDVKNVDQTVYPVSKKLQQQIEAMVRSAHKALGCSGYSLFDIRVDAVSGRPYIIECCAFWSMSSISILTCLLTNSGVDYNRVILDLWRETALTASAAKERTAIFKTKSVFPPLPASSSVGVIVSK